MGVDVGVAVTVGVVVKGVSRVGGTVTSGSGVAVDGMDALGCSKTRGRYRALLVVLALSSPFVIAGS